MKTNPDKSLAENVITVMRAIRKGRYHGLKEWETDLLRQATDDLERERADSNRTDSNG